MLYLGNRITPPDLEATQATDGMAGEWSELLRSPRAAARLFAALHAWQAVVASRRLRFQAAERARDGLAVAFFEVRGGVWRWFAVVSGLMRLR